MTTWVTSNSVSHSAISSNSRVKVPKRRSSFSALPCSRMITHAEMLFLCTSSPQHLEYTTSTHTSLGSPPVAAARKGSSPTCSLLSKSHNSLCLYAASDRVLTFRDADGRVPDGD